MDNDHGVESAWRDALAAKGRDRVMAQLTERSGRPDEPVFDLVFEGPLPTKEFCFRWCAEQDNKIFAFSKNRVYVILAFVIFLVSVIKICSGWSSAAPPVDPFSNAVHASNGAMVDGNIFAGSTQIGSPSSSNDSTDISVPTSASMSPSNIEGIPSVGTGSSTSGDTSSDSGSLSLVNPSLPSVCAYETYETAECSTQQ